MPALPVPSSSASACHWCGQSVSASDLSCPSCGAGIRLARKTGGSGWTELPAIKDMTRLRIGNSTCQIEGNYVPVADFNLDAADSVYFAHHVLLWKDPQVEIRRMPLAGGFRRLMAGLPIIMTDARGPGHIAFSRDDPGEMIALPLQPGQAIDVREHLFLAATSAVSYGWHASNLWFTTGSGKELETHYPLGQFIDRFTAPAGAGLLLLHASGNVFVRELAPNQTIYIKPTALVYKDVSMPMGLEFEYPMNYASQWHRLLWLRLTGPGRVAVQSAYEPMEDNGRVITGISTQRY